VAKKIVQVPVDELFIKKLDKVCAGRSRAEVMRRAFIQYYDLMNEKKLDELYLAGYKKTPSDSSIAEAQKKTISDIFMGESW